MVNMDNLSLVVSKYLNRDVKEIGFDTIINRSAIGSSINNHKFRSEVNGLLKRKVDWNSVNCLADILLDNQTKNHQPAGLNHTDFNESSNDLNIDDYPDNITSNNVGVDIVAVDSLPDTNDYWECNFYIENFTCSEIALCTRRDDPKMCFAARFATKEAIFKATNGSCGSNFSKIETYYKGGRLVNEFCEISISYLDHKSIRLAVATASAKD